MELCGFTPIKKQALNDSNDWIALNDQAICERFAKQAWKCTQPCPLCCQLKFASAILAMLDAHDIYPHCSANRGYYGNAVKEVN